MALNSEMDPLPLFSSVGWSLFIDSSQLFGTVLRCYCLDIRKFVFHSFVLHGLSTVFDDSKYGWLLIHCIRGTPPFCTWFSGEIYSRIVLSPAYRLIFIPSLILKLRVSWFWNFSSALGWFVSMPSCCFKTSTQKVCQTILPQVTLNILFGFLNPLIATYISCHENHNNPATTEARALE